MEGQLYKSDLISLPQTLMEKSFAVCVTHLKHITFGVPANVDHIHTTLTTYTTSPVKKGNFFYVTQYYLMYTTQ